jgi:hypothetical protein
MGWSFGWNSKTEIVNYLLKPWGESETHTPLAHSCAGNVLWIVTECRNTETGEAINLILCSLLKCAEGDWGYKGMCEESGPYQYTCPLKYLEMTPVVTCPEWREKVREYHAGKKQARATSNTLQAGTKIVLSGNWSVKEFTLAQKVKKTWRAYGPDGHIYRLPLAAIQSATVQL